MATRHAKVSSKRKNGREEIERLNRDGAFKNLGPNRDAQEVMIHVYWSALNYGDDDDRGHLMQRGKVAADLGLDAVPDPPFTRDEMEIITRAAKLQALKCLGARKRR
jgi:hypothetical protein